jgi:hypothetical protein
MIDPQWAGPVLGVVTLGTIAAGHVIVRKVNYLWGTRTAPAFFVVGAAALAASLLLSSDLLSAIAGIFGITTTWDGVELYRQEERVRRGRAPRNPNREVEPRRGERIS